MESRQRTMLNLEILKFSSDSLEIRLSNISRIHEDTRLFWVKMEL